MDVKSIDALTAKDWLDKNEAILIDVREPAEYAAENISGSTLCSLSKVCFSNIPSTKKKIIIHCQKGFRGINACQKLLSENNDFLVYNIEGGIEAWKEAGFDTEKGQNKVIPLNRQVQLTIGVFVLFFSSMAYFVDNIYALGSAFFGLGLINAGITGWCGLGKFIAKMPWNQ